MPRHLDKHFRNPPRGGNERGVQTQNPMSPHPPTSEYELSNGGELESGRQQQQGAPGPSRQGGLKECFQAGESTARANMQESRQAGKEDFRNYERSPQPMPGSGYAGEEAEQDSSAAQIRGTSGAADRGGRSYTSGNPAPRYNQDTSQSERSDGKPKDDMGTANGNRGGYVNEGNRRTGPFD